MARKTTRIRLYVDHPLTYAQRVALTQDQAHYLFGVMRLSVGDELLLFNGQDGEWRCEVAQTGKKSGVLSPMEQIRPQSAPPDLWLVAAPIRKERLSVMVEKAVELGAARIVLMQTDYTQAANRVRLDKLQAQAVEAAEQCEALYVPQVIAPVKFTRLLDTWDAERAILFCDETAAGAAPSLPSTPGPWAIFIGPEGGFSPTERDRLRAHPQAHATSLGPRILRAETAAIAALTLWQSHLGDWT